MQKTISLNDAMHRVSKAGFELVARFDPPGSNCVSGLVVKGSGRQIPISASGRIEENFIPKDRVIGAVTNLREGTNPCWTPAL